MACVKGPSIISSSLGSPYEGLSSDDNCVALAKADDGHVFELGPCDKDAYYICQTGRMRYREMHDFSSPILHTRLLFADQTLQKQYLPYQPEPTSVHLLDSTTGKAILPTENNLSPPPTAEQRLGYSALWSPANLNGFPLFGGPALESYVEVQKGELTGGSNEFTIMFWYKIDAGLHDSSVFHTLLVSNMRKNAL